MAAEPHTLESLLERIRRDGVRRAAVALRKPPVPSRLLQELSEVPGTPEARQFVAAYPLSPSHLLESLAQQAPDAAVLSLLATNPRTPPHLLSEFAAHADAAVRAQVALHPQIPPRELRTLTEDSSRRVRRAVAANPSLRLPHQALLSADTDAAVRVRLAGQSTLPKPIALVLGADESPVVRLHTVAAARVDEDVLLGWAASDDEDVQLALIRRGDLTPAVRRVLLHSPHAAARRAVRDAGKWDDVDLLMLATRGETEERIWVAGRDLLARPLQNTLAQDAAVEVREALAANVSLDEEIARFFVGQADARVCAALATNPAVPLDLVQELAATRHPEVLAALAYRDVLEGELFQFLLVHSAEFRGHWAMQRRETGPLEAETAKVLCGDALPAVRALGVAGGPLRAAELWDYVRDPAAVVRLAAVRNAAATDAMLDEGATDADPEVAAAAQALREARAKAAAGRPLAGALASRGAVAATAAVVETKAAPVDGGRGIAVAPAAPGPKPAPRFVARSSPGLFNKLKRIFWE